jgi:hypothetical protein
MVLWASSSQLQQTPVISELEVHIKTIAWAWHFTTIARVKLTILPATPLVSMKSECFAHLAASSDSYKLLRAIAKSGNYLW